MEDLEGFVNELLDGLGKKASVKMPFHEEIFLDGGAAYKQDCVS